MATPFQRLCSLDGSYAQVVVYWTLSQLLAAALYGVVITLGCASVSLIRQTRGGMQTQENRMLVAYVAGMMCFSTISIISCIVELAKTIESQCFVPGTSFLGKPGMIAFVWANWGADGFLLWRCWRLYNGLLSTLFRRAVRFAVAFLGLASLTVGISYLSLAFTANSSASLVLFATACGSLSIHLFISLLIAGRIWYTASSLQELFGKNHVTLYRKIIGMLVESAALVVVFYLLYIVTAVLAPLRLAQDLELRSFHTLAPLLSLTQICAIASLFIVYRVARGRIRTTPPSIGFLNSPNDDALAFAVACLDVTSTATTGSPIPEQEEQEEGNA